MWERNTLILIDPLNIKNDYVIIIIVINHNINNNNIVIKYLNTSQVFPRHLCLSSLTIVTQPPSTTYVSFS